MNSSNDRYTQLANERDGLLQDMRQAEAFLFAARGGVKEAEAQGAYARAEAALDAWLTSPEGEEFARLDMACGGFAQAQREFRSWLHLYGLEDLTMPEGFTDTSWHNDACPSIEGKGVRVWLDAMDPLRRECGGEPSTRFMVQALDSEGCPTGEVLAGSDDWEAITRFLRTLPRPE